MPRKYLINHAFLDYGLISSKHAWMWGLFLTDGNIDLDNRSSRPSRIRWSQKYDSYPMLEEIRKAVDSTHPLTFHSYSGISIQCSLNLSCTHLAESAARLLNCNVSRKTFDLTFPDISDDHLPALIRGIHDGDGSWVFNMCEYPKMSLNIASSNIDFLQSLRKSINIHCLQTEAELGYIYKNSLSNSYSLYYEKKYELKVIGQWMYDSVDVNTLSMKQKYERFQFWRDHFLDDKVCVSDRFHLMKAFKAEEKAVSLQVLNKLIAMNKSELECPKHFKFRKSFLSLQIR